MSLGTCLADLRARKVISDQRAEELGSRYDELVAQYEARYGRAAAESMASEKVLELADLDAMHRKRQVLLQAKAQGYWLGRMRLASPEGGPLSRRAAEDFIVDMDGHARAIRQQALQMNGALLEKHRRTLVGEVREKAGLDDVRRALWGDETVSANAREIADAWRQSSEWLRSRFNAAGGRIAKLESWRLPQRHDMRSVREAGFPAWRDFIVPRLDRAAMIDRATGEPFTDAKLELVLQDMWTAIATDGWSRNNPGGIHGGATGNQRADHRVLHFATADGWDEYAQAFGGGGTVFDAMIAHIDAMSRDVAAMERMGPNPNASLRFMQDWLAKSTEQAMLGGRAGRKASDDASAGSGALQRLFDEFTGASQVPERRRLALGFSIFRAQQTAAKLGGALLSVGGDYGLMVKTSRFNGIPAGKVMARYVGLLNPAATADRAQAARHVLMADQWADGHAGQWRSLGEELAHEGARRMATGVLRASGLVAHTDIAKQAFGMELVAHLTHMRDRSFANLHPAMQAMLQRYGIGEGRWDGLRAVTPESYNGTDWLYPETVAQAGDQALADDMMRMIVTEADYAVPTPDLRTRAAISGIGRKGTLGGEVVRSAFLFKGFPLTVLNMHGRRMLDQGMGGAEAAGHIGMLLIMRYGLSMLALTTLGGALSLQVKEIAKGRDPVPMDGAKFWGSALAQGGGLGIIGDLLYSAENRFGGGPAETLIGPMGQVINNTGGAVVRNTTATFDGDDETETQWSKDAAKLVMSEVPGMSLWYARLLIDRTLGDLVTEWSYGEDAAARYRRLEQYAEERGTQFYAPPGSGGDWRAPDLGNALGGQEAEAEVAGVAL